MPGAFPVDKEAGPANAMMPQNQETPFCPADPAPLSGTLGAFAFVDVIQMIANAGKTGELTISQADSQARMHFNNGNLVDAEYRECYGKDAFEKILLLQDGYFEFRTGQLSQKRSIKASLTQLLLDAFRKMDESQRENPTPRGLQYRAG
jgi:hypothetical protein